MSLSCTNIEWLLYLPSGNPFTSCKTLLVLRQSPPWRTVRRNAL
jgi:hypothetical protein